MVLAVLVVGVVVEIGDGGLSSGGIGGGGGLSSVGGGDGSGSSGCRGGSGVPRGGGGGGGGSGGRGDGEGSDHYLHLLCLTMSWAPCSTTVPPYSSSETLQCILFVFH